MYSINFGVQEKSILEISFADFGEQDMTKDQLKSHI